MLFGYSYLGEKRGPDRLNIDDVGGLDEGLDLVGLDCKISFSVTPLNCSRPPAWFRSPERAGLLLTVISTPSSARISAA